MTDATEKSVERLASGACFEFVAWDAPNSLGAELPIEPGEMRRDAAGRAQALYFAPRRWLIPAPSAPLAARLSALADAGAGSLIDVEGKWQAFRLRGAHALSILESLMNVDRVLRDRVCAALPLFDCPAIVARADAGFDVWVASSYAASFSSAVDALVRRDFLADAS